MSETEMSLKFTHLFIVITCISYKKCLWKNVIILLYFVKIMTEYKMDIQPCLLFYVSFEENVTEVSQWITNTEALVAGKLKVNQSRF